MQRKSITELCLFFVLATVAAITLGGCSGKDGANGTNGVVLPTVGTVNASTFSNDDLNNVIPVGKILSASIPPGGKNPTVTFQVVDKVSNVGITGLKTFGLHIARLVPEDTVTRTSSYWVNYIDKGISLPAPLAFGTTIVSGKVTANTGAITKPSADPGITFVPATSVGVDLVAHPVGSVLIPGYTVVDHGDGTYTATFGSDITSNPNASYIPTALHRIGVTVTSIATPGVTATGPLTPSNVVNTSFLAQNRLGMVYDFTPSTGAMMTDATGKQAFARDNVTTAACNECHYNIALIGGHQAARPDTKLCVMCHTKTNTSGEGEFVTFIHRIHMGDKLPLLPKPEATLNPTKPLPHALLVDYQTQTYPQDIRNCTKCHKGVDGANWQSQPNRLNCGSCHNGIDFATGLGTRINGLTTGHVGGIQRDDSGCNLTACHGGAVSTASTHITNDSTPNNPNVPAGAAKISYAISSVTLNASRQPVVVFQITINGTAVTSLATPALVTDLVTGQQVIDPKFAPIPGFNGGPSLYVVYSVPQDGITAPADFNARSNVSLASLLVTAGSPKAGTLTGPDANGFWTATLTGDTLGQPTPILGAAPKAVPASPIFVPASAKMLTGALIGNFTQTNLAAFPYTPKSFGNPNVNASGGLVRDTLAQQKVATGFTGRRAIVDTAKCTKCHEQLGVSPDFHGGARNDATLCAFCHNPNFTQSGWSAASRNFVHAIHSAQGSDARRTVPFTWHATSATDSFANVTYPGYLRNCEQCHLTTTNESVNTFDFSAVATLNAVPNMLYSTVATGKYNGADATVNFMLSPYIIKDNIKDYGVGFSFTPTTLAGTTVEAAATTLVNSPIASACFSCHDTPVAKAHMNVMGGSIYAPRGTPDTPATSTAPAVPGTGALGTKETCLVCHGTADNATNNSVQTIKAVHRWW